MKIEYVELRPVDFFSLQPAALQALRKAGSIELIWTRIAGAGFRIVVMIVPAQACWAMQFNHAQADLDWFESIICDSAVARQMAGLFGTLRIEPRTVPETLAGCSSYGAENELEMGGGVPDWPHCHFRSTLVPDDDRAFEAFLDRMQAHVDQLQHFFVLPEPALAGVPLMQWAASTDPRMEQLFGSARSGVRPRSNAFETQIKALEHALMAVTSDEARQWLTPQFLEFDELRPAYPIAATELQTKRTASFLAVFGLRAAADIHAYAKTIALLRFQLMNKWRWPVGIRRLVRRQQSPDTIKTALHGSLPWQPVEDEATKLLQGAAVLYPVLFD